jgi:hypothetical protein
MIKEIKDSFDSELIIILIFKKKIIFNFIWKFISNIFFISNIITLSIENCSPLKFFKKNWKKSQVSYGWNSHFTEFQIFWDNIVGIIGKSWCFSVTTLIEIVSGSNSSQKLTTIIKNVKIILFCCWICKHC